MVMIEQKLKRRFINYKIILYLKLYVQKNTHWFSNFFVNK